METETLLTSLLLALWTTQILQQKSRLVVPPATPYPRTIGGWGAATTVGITTDTASDDLHGVTIQLSPPEDNIKDLSANIGQTKSKLSFIRGNWDMVISIITHVAYSLPLKSLLIVHNMPHAVPDNLMQSMLQIGCNTAKAGLVSSSFAKLVTIHVVQKAMITNLLHRNLKVARVGNLWDDASFLISTAYLPQLDTAKVERI